MSNEARQCHSFLHLLTRDWHGGWLNRKKISAFVLRGPAIRCEDPGTAERSAVSLMSLWQFQRFYGMKYGHGASPADRIKIWEKAKAGQLTVPTDALELNGSNHCVWFVDEEQLSTNLGGGGKLGRIHANSAYDLLGLDWRDDRNWENPGTVDCRAKTMLVRSPLGHRHTAERGLCVPTAIEAWGSLLWAPRKTGYGAPWPQGGGRTVNPENGQEELPEGVHGPLEFGGAYHENPVKALGEVSGPARAARLGHLVPQR